MKRQSVIICVGACILFVIVLLVCIFAAKIQLIQNTAINVNGSEVAIMLNTEQHLYVSHQSSHHAYQIDIDNNRNYELCYLVYHERVDEYYSYYCNMPTYIPTSEGNYYVNFSFGDMNLFTFFYYF